VSLLALSDQNNSMEKRQIIIVAAALAIIFISYFSSEYLASLKEEPVIRKAPQAKKFVETQPVAYADLKTHVISYGRIENAQSLDMIAEVSGRMSQGIRLKPGQRFSKGDLIFSVDSEEATLNLKAQKSTFLRDLAGILPDLKIDFADSYEAWSKYFNSLDIDKQFKELPKPGSAKEKTFLATKGIYSSFYSIKSAEARLQKHRYYAPFSGSIMEVALQSGSYVNAGTRIGKILRSGDHEMKVAIETRDIPWIQVGSPVEIYSEESQQYWKGTVSRISDYVNQNTQSVDAFVTIHSNGQKLYDGQFFKASIPARTIKDGMIMPRNAIYNGSEVFVLEDSSLSRRTINIIRLSEEEAIFNGLEIGDELVVEPLLGAYNNMRAFKKEKKDIDLEIKEEGNEQKINTTTTSN
jgi:multidrug efflux pump subunit AcrA (membrane-fusion protein)